LEAKQLGDSLQKKNYLKIDYSIYVCVCVFVHQSFTTYIEC